MRLLSFVSALSLVSSTTYEFVPGHFTLPANAPPMMHGHGLAKDVDGVVFFTYVLDAAPPAPSDRCLVAFTPNPLTGLYGEGVVIGDPQLSQGTPHGLRIDYAADGASLYHANNNQVVRKTTLEGNVVWTGGLTPPNNDSAYYPFSPTDAVVAPPGSDNLFVSDGYGSSYVHRMSASTGEWSGLTFGGHGDDSAAHGSLNTPHGINWDPRVSLLLISDRSNGRLEYFNLDGSFNRTAVEAGSFLSQPCNVDICADDGWALVPDLDGPAFVLDAMNGLVTSVDVPGQAAARGDDGFLHPHDAVFLPDGGFVLCTWNPGRIGYWRRVD